MPRVTFRQVGGLEIAEVSFPASGAEGRITCGAVGDTKADALHRASLLAERIASDPVLSALMPPQAKAAIAAAKALGGAAARGLPALRSIWGKLRGKGKKRLAAALVHEAAAEAPPSEVAGFESLISAAAKFATSDKGKAALRKAKALVRRKRKRKGKGNPRKPPPLSPRPRDDFAEMTDEDPAEEFVPEDAEPEGDQGDQVDQLDQGDQGDEQADSGADGER